MFDKVCLALVGALIVLPQTAFAAGNPASLCVDASLPRPRSPPTTANGSN
jgi:hypothetical protein